jgi:tetratricopeptide (TPR) repeat protein
VQKFDAPVEATTSSLEALKAYSKAVTTGRTKGDMEAIPFCKRAIELDPNFALAYASLGAAYMSLGESRLAEANLKKAYDLRERVSEREKYRISDYYYDLSAGDTEKALQVCESWVANYPQDAVARGSLSGLYETLGRWEKAVAQEEEGQHLRPNDARSYSALAHDYLALNRLSDARSTIRQAQERKLDDDLWLRLWMYDLAFLDGDAERMEQQVAWAAGKPGEDRFVSKQSETERYYGRLANAHELTRRATGLALRANSKENASRWYFDAAWGETDLGNMTAARQYVDAALVSCPIGS